jgi:sugar phosphate isomerase/epimerase
MEWSRRDVLRMAAFGGVHALMGAVDAAAAGTRPLGVQLYTVREQLKGDPRAVLAGIAKIGYKTVELGRAEAPKLVPIAREVGLRAASSHIESALVTGKWEPAVQSAKFMKQPPPNQSLTLERALGDLRGLGIEYAVVAYLTPQERGRDAAAYERLADQLNRAGEQGRKAGITIGYHNHGFEFAPLPDGRRPIDILFERLDPALATLELDVFWAAITGADPVQLIQAHAKHIKLLHLKGLRHGAATRTDEATVPHQDFVDVGSGSQDFRAILAAADRAGINQLFVEQDQTPGDPLASLQKSYTYLESLA